MPGTGEMYSDAIYKLGMPGFRWGKAVFRKPRRTGRKGERIQISPEHRVAPGIARPSVIPFSLVHSIWHWDHGRRTSRNA